MNWKYWNEFFFYRSATWEQMLLQRVDMVLTSASTRSTSGCLRMAAVTALRDLTTIWRTEPTSWHSWSMTPWLLSIWHCISPSPTWICLKKTQSSSVNFHSIEMFHSFDWILYLLRCNIKLISLVHSFFLLKFEFIFIEISIRFHSNIKWI